MRPLGELDDFAQAAGVLDGRPHHALRLYLLVFLPPILLGGALAPPHDLPQPEHVLARHDLVLHAAEHQNWDPLRNERELGRAIPLLVAQEGERAKQRQRGRHEPREREEGVLEDEGADLCEWYQWWGEQKEERRLMGRTERGFRLARSIETAPPMDWP